MRVPNTHLDSSVEAFELQLRDIDELISTRKENGHENEDRTENFDEVLRIQKEELQETLQSLRDHLMCRSLSRAVHEDAVILAQIQEEENQCRQDREEARALAGIEDEDLGHTITPTPILDALNDDEIERFSAMNIFERDESDKAPGSDATASSTEECVACTEEVSSTNAFCAPCGHHYCKTCVEKLCEDALVDESLFPPRCCRQNMPISELADVIDANMMEKTQLKAIELATTNRVYCSNVDCGTFIIPQQIQNDHGSCLKCLQKTCAKCKKGVHEGDCEEFESGEQEVLRLAAQSGWQRCYQCQTFVELSIGCNHITCRCGGEFCYVCGKEWKTCPCDQWHEHRLLHRAAEVVDRDWPDEEVNRPERNEWINAVANNLRENHECNHRGQWRKVDGAFPCEHCHTTMPEFIFECSQCLIRACRRCRDNRF